MIFGLYDRSGPTWNPLGSAWFAGLSAFRGLGTSHRILRFSTRGNSAPPTTLGAGSPKRGKPTAFTLTDQRTQIPKMSTPNLDAGLRAELAAIAEGIGCELLAIERQGKILRVFLDREDGGVTLEHCQTVSREFSALLDAHDFGSKRYILEVSSPGLDRKLYKPADYRRFQGHLAKITFFEGPERKKKTLIGRLGELRDDESLSVEPEPKGDPIDIPLADISVARLEVEF